ncbi:DUF4349 domain-containing protein [Magnetovibrio sp. PR-2]|uniref:DUF4349 domain-containing protein n=1 Tax=Magnetovibrio sp. PR-2 TaxID=3120356 RepID=UPI002FCE392C
MKNPVRIGVVLVAVSVLLSACDPESSDDNSRSSAPPMGKAMLMAADAPMMRSEAAMASNAGPRMEIGRNYSLEIDDDINAQLERDRTECLKLNCVITNQSQTGHAQRPTAHLRAQVPGEKANQFHAFLSEGEGRHIVNFNETARNRDQAYQDTEARIKRLNFMRERLYALADKKSSKIGDLVQVERELMRVEGDIERLTRQKQNIEKVTDNVTFSISYALRPPKAGDVNLGPLSGLLSDSFNAFIRGIRATTIWIARWLPVVLLAGLGLWLWRRRRSDDG